MTILFHIICGFHSKLTGMKQKKIFQMLIRDYYNEVTKIILDSNDYLIEQPKTKGKTNG